MFGSNASAGVYTIWIVVLTFTVLQVYLPAFYVAFDHKTKSVVIAIRGSSSFSVRN